MKEHDRYFVYCLLNRQICFRTPVALGDKWVEGLVTKVVRNIFDNTIEITVNGEIFSFREPTWIAKSGENVIFIYGQKGRIDEEDEAELWCEIRKSSYFGETVFDVIERTQGEITLVNFRLGLKKRKAKRRKHWKRKVMVIA